MFLTKLKRLVIDKGLCSRNSGYMGRVIILRDNKAYLLTKRVFDVVASAMGILITLPFWIIAAAGILISDPGPIFYIANRVGIHKKPFRMFKFRSMRTDKKANERTLKADKARIFNFGAMMRATKIDELPQLLNVLFGDMSVIGPRPASVDQIGIVRAGKYEIISFVKPGLSGPSALYDYMYGDTIEDEDEYKEKVLPIRLALDEHYVRNMGCWYDLILILQTIICIINAVFKKTPKGLLQSLESKVQKNVLKDLNNKPKYSYNMQQ